MSEDEPSADRLRSIEERLARLEQHLGVSPSPIDRQPHAEMTTAPAQDRGEDEIEYEIGQNWFAKAGIVVLALGMVFLLTFPYTELPAAAPGIIGYALAGSLFLAARVLRTSFDLVSRYLRGAGMVLLFFTTLRFLYFSQTPLIEASSTPAL